MSNVNFKLSSISIIVVRKDICLYNGNIVTNIMDNLDIKYNG